MGMCSSRFWAARWGQRALPEGANRGALGTMRRAKAVAAAFAAIMPFALLADGVTRSVEPVAGGCRVTLAWEFTGKVESDLIIEERLANGWQVDDATVPFGSLDASWFSGNVARFAVKPTLLSDAGSISFTVVSGEEAASGTVAGDWKMYLDGELSKGAVAGQSGLAALSAAAGTNGTDGTNGTEATTGSAEKTGVVEKAVAITSFKILGGGVVELSYRSVSNAGTIVVEGCEGLGKSWNEVKRVAVNAGDASVRLEPGEIGGIRFFRIKLLTDEE